MSLVLSSMKCSCAENTVTQTFFRFIKALFIAMKFGPFHLSWDLVSNIWLWVTYCVRPSLPIYYSIYNNCMFQYVCCSWHYLSICIIVSESCRHFFLGICMPLAQSVQFCHCFRILQTFMSGDICAIGIICVVVLLYRILQRPHPCTLH